MSIFQWTAVLRYSDHVVPYRQLLLTWLVRCYFSGHGQTWRALHAPMTSIYEAGRNSFEDSINKHWRCNIFPLYHKLSHTIWACCDIISISESKSTYSGMQIWLSCFYLNETVCFKNIQFKPWHNHELRIFRTEFGKLWATQSGFEAGPAWRRGLNSVRSGSPFQTKLLCEA